MTKKTLNQNAKYTEQLIDIIEPDFNFSNKPLNRFKTVFRVLLVLGVYIQINGQMLNHYRYSTLSNYK